MANLKGVPAGHTPWQTKSGIPAFIRLVEGQRGIYKESWAKDRNTVTILADVDWDLRQQFRQDMLGYVNGLAVNEPPQYASDPGAFLADLGISIATGDVLKLINTEVPQPTFQRILPENCPVEPSLWCMSCDLMDAYGNPRQVALSGSVKTNDNGVAWTLADYFASGDPRDVAIARIGAWPEYDRAVYECVFATVPWKMLTDDAITTEADRFVFTKHRFTAREQKVPGGGFYLSDDGKTPNLNKPLGEVGFRVSTVVEYESRWYQVPVDYLPETAIRECTGRVNAVPFVLRGQACAPETVLFRGATPEFYYTPRGDFVADLVYLFGYRNETWNVFPDRNGQYFRALTKDGRTLYPAADHNRLYTPAG